MLGKPHPVDQVIKGRISVVIPCYRDSERTVTLVRSLEGQLLPPAWTLEIVVVDDGSGPPHDARLASVADEATAIVTLPVNVGRTRAREAGIGLSAGEFLMLIDADCLPAHERCLEAHVKAMSAATVVASVGPVRGNGNRFWDRYQDTVMERRSKRFARSQGLLGSTANICIRRSAYVRAGGLDDSYSGYGFEDRDLLLRLAGVGTVAWTSDAAVLHTDQMSLPGICAKLADAGERNSRVFSRRHPEAYRQLGYSRLDARGRPILEWLGRFLDPVIPRIAAGIERVLEHIPFALARFLVKALSALAFLAGTSRRSSRAHE